MLQFWTFLLWWDRTKQLISSPWSGDTEVGGHGWSLLAEGLHTQSVTLKNVFAQKQDLQTGSRDDLLIDLCFSFIVFISCSELGMQGHPFEEKWGFVHCLLFMALFAVICIAILSPKLQANTFVLHCILNTIILRSFWCDENYFSEWAWNHQLFDWSHVSIQNTFSHQRTV